MRGTLCVCARPHAHARAVCAQKGNTWRVSGVTRAYALCASAPVLMQGRTACVYRQSVACMFLSVCLQVADPASGDAVLSANKFGFATRAICVGASLVAVDSDIFHFILRNASSQSVLSLLRQWMRNLEVQGKFAGYCEDMFPNERRLGRQLLSCVALLREFARRTTQQRQGVTVDQALLTLSRARRTL